MSKGMSSASRQEHAATTMLMSRTTGLQLILIPATSATAKERIIPQTV
jgi:hypothetical protein